MGILNKRVATSFAVAAVMLFARAAAADSVVIKTFGYSNPRDVNISEAGQTIGQLSRGGNVAPGKSLDVYADAFSVTDNGTSFLAYCADIYKYDAWNVTTNYTPGNLATTFSAAKANSLEQLATLYYGDVTNATTSAAFQMSVWEILFESGSSYSLSQGSFEAVGGSAASGTVSNPSAIALAQSWLGNLAAAPSTPAYDVNYLQVASGNQNLVYFTPVSSDRSFSVSSIPEPDVYMSLASGLGLLGLMFRRRNC